ncbi:bifunctional glutamate--cysteine ligase GshA/glutathione synthetase GshB [Lactococcus laudensis]|uniref:Bifunctional glutamate--cysteine ligase GshA/glutathione synthetase GshB n=1 Tax=Pseudolactococcus laudensis TaxID=1494461 RepID=A0A7V8SJ80_9LACT|nr:bifunctional glutamate--cysteine ligase GshA/glutathione synthetase GshB [Lactococcus laudensis]MBA0016048.1 bifunctional glutamate--cysteine ligase GshA/glutathione synthetase GshB [Lactococcus laudensis]MBW9281809.1 bifunctional glutamate--cysteine ligase GshA/glutathione synthetase GshB [Lactococcus laudensis]
MEKTFKISRITSPNMLNTQNAYWYINDDLLTITYHTNRDLSAILAVLSRHGIDIQYVQAPANDFQLPGYENLELSTQNLIADAIKYGIQFQVLDEVEQILKLTYGSHTEYIKEGNITHFDSALSHALMENKIVTKAILNTAGIQVPSGFEFHDLNDALRHFDQLPSAFVVKPKSTNYGIGISIFKETTTQADYEEAVKIAFENDDAIIVETYAHGTEFRFYVQNGEVLAVLERFPANVVGDGVHSIQQLVAIKNTDIRRGEHHRTPLEKIKLGDVERLTLSLQGFDVQSVPKAQERVFLRENSNVSTGGDSIDRTEQVSDYYKAIAVKVAHALDVTITGVDIIIPDASQKGPYFVIEANQNPMMQMHLFPAIGKSRRVTESLIKLLFPESI